LLALFCSPTLKAVFLAVFIIATIYFYSCNYKTLEIKSIPWFFKLFFLNELLRLLLGIFHNANYILHFKNFFLAIITWLAISLILQNADKQKLAQTVSLSGFLVSVYILLQCLSILPVKNPGIYGFLQQPFTNSGLLLAALYFTLYLLDQESRKTYKNIYLVIFLCNLSAIFVLGQVTVWAATLVSLFIYAFLSKKLSLKNLLLLVLVFVSIISLASFSSPRIMRKLSWFTDIKKLTSNRSIECRMAIWQINLDKLKTSPILGFDKVQPYLCEMKDEVSKLSHAHNIYLQKLFEGGLIKFFVWMLFYCSLGLMLYSTKSYSFLCYFLAISLEGLLENWWGDSEVLSLFLFTMLFVYHVELTNVRKTK
jgi:O-antigen ligase